MLAQTLPLPPSLPLPLPQPLLGVELTEETLRDLAEECGEEGITNNSRVSNDNFLYQ